jgi:hypothetical protein
MFMPAGRSLALMVASALPLAAISIHFFLQSLQVVEKFFRNFPVNTA